MTFYVVVLARIKYTNNNSIIKNRKDHKKQTLPQLSNAKYNCDKNCFL
jgi:hypothetical protein